MRYNCDCLYIGSRGTSKIDTAVDGLLLLLRNKCGGITLKIKVHRRESVDLYLKQILVGVRAKEHYFQKIYGTSVNLEVLFSSILTRHCINKTEGYKSTHNDKNIIAYYEIDLKYEDLVNA